MEQLVQAGLVLEGGGLRGQYTAGVLDSFLRANLVFPYTIGVSAGASMACSYISKQFGRNRVIIQKYRRDPRYLSLRNLLFTGSLFGMDFIFREIPQNLVPFDFKTFEGAPERFVIVCTDCLTGEAVYYEKNDHDPMKVLCASASLPFLSPMVAYQGKKLLDGALADSIPIRRAQSEGYKKNIVILTREKGYRKSPPQPLMAKIRYHRFPKLVKAINTRWENYNETLDYLDQEEERGQTLVIRPSENLAISRTEKSVEKLEALYELGLKDGLLWAQRIRQWT